MSLHIRDVYLAAPYSQQAYLRNVRQAMEGDGFNITSRWLDFNTGQYAQLSWAQREEEALIDLDDIKRSDLLLVFTEHASESLGGMHFETGYAHAAGIPVWVVGPQVMIFHHLSTISTFANLGDVYKELKRYA